MRLACIVLFSACTGPNGTVLTDLNGVDSALPTPDASVSQQPWTKMTSNTTVDLYAAYAANPTNIVAVGGQPGNTAGNPGVTLNYYGANWMPAPNLVNLLGVSELYAVGEYGGEGSVIKASAEVWLPRQVLGAGFLRGTWDSSIGSYVVGDNGQLYVKSYAAATETWSKLTTNVTTGLYAVWGPTATEVYAVGAGGVILHNTNVGGGTAGTWTKTTVGSSTLRAIWGTSPDNIYIVGEAPAVILHSTDGGTSWTEATLPASAIGLHAIAGNNANDVYAVGSTGGLAFHSTGNDEWTTQPLPATYDMFGLAIASSGDIYAVGRNGSIYHKAP